MPDRVKDLHGILLDHFKNYNAKEGVPTIETPSSLIPGIK